jgi:hypothetical protein
MNSRFLCEDGNFIKRDGNFATFDEYHSYFCNATKHLFENEEEAIQYLLCYPHFWNTPPDRDIVDLQSYVAIAKHRREAASRARVAVYGALKGRIGRDVAGTIAKMMKEHSYVAKKQWGEPGLWQQLRESEDAIMALKRVGQWLFTYEK